MLKPARMKKVDLLVLSDKIDELTEEIGRMGIVQLMDVKPSAEVPGLREVDSGGRMAKWNEIERGAVSVMRMLEMPEEEAPPTPKIWPPEKIAARLTEIEKAAKEIVGRKQRLEESLARMKETHREVESFLHIDADVEHINDFSFLHFAVGSLSPLALKKFQKDCPNEEAILIPFTTSLGESKLVAITTKKQRWGLETDLANVGFEKEDISKKYEGAPHKIIADVAKQSEQASAELEQVRGQIAKMRGQCSREVLGMRARAQVEKKILDAQAHFGMTENTFFISGWAPADRVDELSKRIGELTGERCFIQSHDPSSLKEVKEGRAAVPVLLSNPRILKPFERLITTYGFPTYNEIEPTLFVALSFLLMFGLMFGDLGQGLLIALGGVAMLTVPALRRKTGDAGLIFVGAGLSGALFGVLYGSVFASEEIIRPLWKSPMEDIMSFFAVGVLIGVVMILLGLAINIINCLKRRDYLHGVFDKLGIVGAIFYVGCIGMGIKHIVLDRSDVNMAQIGLFIILPLVILFLREPIYNILTHRPGLIHGDVATYIMESLIEVMETLTSFLANTVSFIRVSAFALSHVGLSVAVFALAASVHEASGSRACSVAMIVLGNAVIIALEGMIVAIQTIRLEYYEFFSKFFGGTGEEFKPFFISR